MSAYITQALTTSSRHNPLYYICLFMNDYSYMTVTVSLREKKLQGLRVIEKFTNVKDKNAQIWPYWYVFVPTPSRKNHAIFTDVNTIFSRFQRCSWTQIIYPMGYTPPTFLLPPDFRFRNPTRIFWLILVPHTVYIFLVIKKACVLM